MPVELTVDEAIERARRTQDNKIAAIRELAMARQSLADTRVEAARKLAELERENADEIAAAERDDARLYTAATKTGWSAAELRKIGFDAPARSRRVARKRSSTTRPSNGADGAVPATPGWVERRLSKRSGVNFPPPMPDRLYRAGAVKRLSRHILPRCAQSGIPRSS